MERVFAYAKVGRSGLGNMLMPWARAEVFSRRTGVRLISPQWVQPKIGPLLRKEADLRYYTSLFSPGDYVTGWRRLWLLGLRRRLTEEHAKHLAETGTLHQEAGIACFSGLGEYLRGMSPYAEYLGRRLWAITSDKVKSSVLDQQDDVDIAVHVRRGDMEIWNGNGVLPNCRTLPDEWYISILESLQDLVRRPLSIRIFSDARSDTIKDLIRVTHSTRTPLGNDVLTDLWLMSKARVFVSTGTSTLSAWASFIGEMPTIWPPGWCGRHTDRREFHYETDSRGHLGEKAKERLRAILSC